MRPNERRFASVEDGLLRRNPAAGLRVIVTNQRPRKQRLTPEQTRSLLAAMPAEHADLAYLLAATGLRISEALSLVWDDFSRDDQGPTLTVRKSKTEAGLRTISLSAETDKRLLKRRMANGALGPIFASARGTAIDANNFRREVFRPAAKAAGVPWATPHTLRHGMASLMADAGLTAAQIAGHLGHADGGVLAMRTYIHADRIAAPDS